MTPALALINTVLQALLIVTAFAAVWLAFKRRLKRHCLVMRAAVAVQILLIAVLMAPAFVGRIRVWDGWSWFGV